MSCAISPPSVTSWSSGSRRPSSRSGRWASPSPSTPRAATSTGAWPFDVIPRVISTDEWQRIVDGLVQRLAALNLFIDDLYGDAARSSPTACSRAELLASTRRTSGPSASASRRPVHGVWAHICGSDLVRDADGTMYVLEDNLRVPSGVSYMLENRQVTKRVFADLFRDLDIHPVDGYPNRLHDHARRRCRPGRASCRSSRCSRPASTTRPTSSTPSSPSRWARTSSRAATSSSTTTTCVHMRTIDGLVRVDVIYRRVDDLFLDPEVFRPDSTLGVPGLMRAWRAGNVAIANAPGCRRRRRQGRLRLRARDHPLLPRRGAARSPTCPPTAASTTAERRHVLANLDELVVKPANESGGYGVFVGPAVDRPSEREEIRDPDRGRPPQLRRPSRSCSSRPRRRSCDGERRAPPPRPAPVHPLGRAALRHPGRAHPRRARARARSS